MAFLKIFICLCLVIYSACENDTNSNITSTQEEINSTATLSINVTTTELVTNSSVVTLTEVSSSLSTTSDDQSTKTSSIGTDHDIEITGTATPPNDETDGLETETTENNQTTEIDIFTTTSKISTEVIVLEPACSQNPCKHGGTCVEDATVPFLFSCICLPGFVGIRCGTVDNCKKDDENHICKNGACVYSEDGLNRSCQCFFGMYWDETLKECREPVLPCFPNPCMNGGTCSNKYGMAHCDCPPGYSGNTCAVLFKCGNCENGTCLSIDEQTMECKCNEGLYWNNDHETCEVMMSPCDLNPCQNKGTCDAISETEFNCSCEIGFSGKTCEITDKCREDKDCGNGVCVLSGDKMSRHCQCNKGFYLQDQTHTCKEITNICQPNPCQNDGICTIVSTSDYNCTCSHGYIGKNCEVRDLCDMDGGKAFCGNGNCSNNYEYGVYFCTCNVGEYFQYSQRKCVELDFCPLVRCESTEVCLMGECECKENYKRDNDTQKCMLDFCSSNPCPVPEMICEEGTGMTDFKCHCPEGFSFNGIQCIETSCIFPKLNLCNQYCSSEKDGYKCSCAVDFKLNEDNRTCTYIGNNTCSNKTCANGFCVNEDNMEMCICPPGFTEIDGICKDVCSSGDLTSGICPSDECEVISEGSFRCKCEGKLTLSKDQTTCMVRNICEVNEIGWKTCKQRNAECISDWLSQSGYYCICAKGQVATEGGICRDICSLENNQRTCSIKGATCEVDNDGRMFCRCPPYFKANERDGKCTRPADFSYVITLPLDKSTYLVQNRQKRSLDSSVDYRKILSDVTATIKDMFTSFSEAKILSCRVLSEYTLCRFELQFKSESENVLKRIELEDLCLTNRNGISNACLLPPSLVLVKNRISENILIQRTNPCDEDIKNEICGSDTTCTSNQTQKSFNCSCKPGYFERRKSYPFGDTSSFIEMCSDIDECAEGIPCPANSNCKNTIGSYTCSCNPGYRRLKDISGTDSQKCVAICHPSPCMHGHCSRRGDHEFDCRCEAGYAGNLCNLQDEHYKQARINTIIVGVVLGGALLITFILFAACISRLRKKKMIENSGHMYYSSTEMTERRRVEVGAVNNAFQRE